MEFSKRKNIFEENPIKGLVSVIIPTYNRSKIFPKAVESVFKQSYKDFEIIIVDDASSDDTKNIVENFQDPRIRYFHHPKNKGEAASTNTGIRKSKGEYITFLDSDDEMMPDKLKKQIGELTLNKEIEAVFTDAMQQDSEEREEVWRPFDPPKGFCNSTGLYRRELFEKIGFLNENLELCSDVEFGVRIARYSIAAVIKEPLMRRTRSKDAVSSKPEASYMKLRSYTSIYKDHAQFLSSRFGKKYLASQIYGWGKFLLKEGRVLEAREFFKEAFFVYPFQTRNFIKFLMTFSSLWTRKWANKK